MVLDADEQADGDVVVRQQTTVRVLDEAKEGELTTILYGS